MHIDSFSSIGRRERTYRSAWNINRSVHYGTSPLELICSRTCLLISYTQYRHWRNSCRIPWETRKTRHIQRNYEPYLITHIYNLWSCILNIYRHIFRISRIDVSLFRHLSLRSLLVDWPRREVRVSACRFVDSYIRSVVNVCICRRPNHCFYRALAAFNKNRLALTPCCKSNHHKDGHIYTEPDLIVSIWSLKAHLLLSLLDEPRCFCYPIKVQGVSPHWVAVYYIRLCEMVSSRANNTPLCISGVEVPSSHSISSVDPKLWRSITGSGNLYKGGFPPLSCSEAGVNGHFCLTQAWIPPFHPMTHTPST